MIKVTLNAGAQPALLAPGGMIVREREPLNLEMPFGTLDAFITPVDRFFVRNHFYGMASVKWLTRIIASAQPFHGYYQTIDYAYWERGPSAPTLVPITEMQVKAQIARFGPP